MKHTPRRLVVILAAAFPCLALADSPAIALDTVVVTGSRIEHNTFDLPAAVDVVDHARINADYAKVNASEALVAVPGISVQNRQNYAQDLQISSRGFGARSAFGVRGIRLVSDGIPASMPDGQGQAATFNLDRAERMEVLRGPMSSVYGNHAGGVIQMFTADGKGAPSIEGGITGGSYGTLKADISAQGEAASGMGYVLDASRFASDGYRDHSKAERDQTMAKLTYAPDADSRLMFIANGFSQKADDPLGLTWSRYQNDPRSVEAVAELYDTRKTIDHAQGGLTYERRFGEDAVQFSAYAGQRSVVQYQSIPRATQLILPSTPANAAVRKSSGGVIDFDRDFAGLAGRWIGRYQLAGGKLTTTVGLEYEQSTDDRRGYENYIGTTLGVKGALRRNEEDRVTSFDQYAQAEWQGERWGFTGGLRHSHVAFKVDDKYIATGNGDDSGNVSYDQTTPMLAALYKLTPSANLYVSAARGFETPTMNELFYSGPANSFSYTLKAATSNHLEAGLKAFVGNDSRLDVALFHIKTEDELVVSSSSGGRTSYRNAGQTTRRGLEAAFDSRWQAGFSTRIAYTGLDARYDEAFTTTVLGAATTVGEGKRLPGVATHTLFGELAWRHAPSGFHTAFETIARSKVYVEDSNTQQAAPSYAIANLRFGVDQQLGGFKLRGFLRLDNIFDRQYVGSVVVGDGNGRFYESAPGRTWLAGISARYAF